MAWVLNQFEYMTFSSKNVNISGRNMTSGENRKKN
jgi:hypothetical protein